MSETSLSLSAYRCAHVYWRSITSGPPPPCSAATIFGCASFADTSSTVRSTPFGFAHSLWSVSLNHLSSSGTKLVQWSRWTLVPFSTTGPDALGDGDVAAGAQAAAAMAAAPYRNRRLESRFVAISRASMTHLP